MGPLIDDILEIKDMLAYSLKSGNDVGAFRKSGLYQDHLKGTEKNLHFGEYSGRAGHRINATVEVMMIGMFRSDVYVYYDTDAVPACIGWLMPPKELWDDKKIEVLDQLSEYYSSDGNLREFMNNPAPYTMQLYQYDTYASGYPYPGKKLYEVGSGTEYNRVEDEEDASHWSGDDGLVPLSSEFRDSESALYMKNESD